MYKTQDHNVFFFLILVYYLYKLSPMHLKDAQKNYYEIKTFIIYCEIKALACSCLHHSFLLSMSLHCFIIWTDFQ